MHFIALDIGIALHINLFYFISLNIGIVLHINVFYCITTMYNFGLQVPRPLTMKKDTIQTRKRKPKCSPNQQQQQQQPKPIHEQLRDSASLTVGGSSLFTHLTLRICDRLERCSINANKQPIEPAGEFFDSIRTRLNRRLDVPADVNSLMGAGSKMALVSPSLGQMAFPSSSQALPLSQTVPYLQSNSPQTVGVGVRQAIQPNVMSTLASSLTGVSDSRH